VLSAGTGAGLEEGVVAGDVSGESFDGTELLHHVLASFSYSHGRGEGHRLLLERAVDGAGNTARQITSLPLQGGSQWSDALLMSYCVLFSVF
jgi:hypothetical protein